MKRCCGSISTILSLLLLASAAGPESAFAAQAAGTSTASYTNALAPPTFDNTIPSYAVALSAYITSYTPSANAKVTALYLSTKVMAQWSNGSVTTWIADPANPAKYAQPGPDMSTLQFAADVTSSDNYPTTLNTKFSVSWVVPDVTLSVAPAAVSVEVGGQAQFRASVGNTDNKVVSWSVQEGAVCGSITAAGLYTAPATPRTCHVVARSVQQSSQSATATVTVAPPSISISGLQAVPGIGQVRLSWTTNLPTTKSISYGTNASCGTGVVDDQAHFTGHSWVVKGLSAGTIYYFCIVSQGELGGVGRATITSKTADGSGAFSSILKVPYCPVSTHSGSACDSGALLVEKGLSEPNEPNVLDDYYCSPEDGAAVDPNSGSPLSIKRITVETVDGLELAEGKRVKATVWVVPALGTDFIDPCPYCDQLDLYYQPNHVPGWGSGWQYLTTLQYPTATTYTATAPQPLTFEFTMGTGAQHVLLANLRNTSEYAYGWDTRNADVCSVGHGDRDTLVFYVKTEPVAPCTKSFSTDTRNCGACGNVCPAAGPNAVATCGGGTCGVSCQSGYYDCNGVASDGCESTDPRCGAPPKPGEYGASCLTDNECSTVCCYSFVCEDLSLCE